MVINHPHQSAAIPPMIEEIILEASKSLVVTNPALFMHLAAKLKAAGKTGDDHLYRYDKLDDFMKIHDQSFRFRNWKPEAGAPLHNNEDLKDIHKRLKAGSGLFRMCFFDTKIDAISYLLGTGRTSVPYILTRIKKEAVFQLPSVSSCRDSAFDTFKRMGSEMGNVLLGSIKRNTPNHPVIKLLETSQSLLGATKASIFYFGETITKTNEQFSDAMLPFDLFNCSSPVGGWHSLNEHAAPIYVESLESLL
jgi:hypothetical protein